MATPPKSGFAMMKPPMPMAEEMPLEEKPVAPAKKGKYPKVPMPPTFTPPDDKQPGDTFQGTFDVRIEPDGKTLCLLTIDGVPFDEEEETDNPEEETAETKPPGSLKEAAAAQREAGLGYTMA